MEIVSSSLKQAALCALISLSGCGKSAHKPEGSEDKASVKSAVQEKPRPATCQGTGPLATDVPPSADLKALCEQLRKAVVGHPHRDEVPREEQETVTKVDTCSDPVKVVSVPAGSPVSEIAVVDVVGELGEVPGEGSYLVAKRAEGYCLMDRALYMEWYHGGYFKNEFDLQFSDESHLAVRAHRVKHTPLDQQVKGEDNSDVDWESCDKSEYERKDAGFRRVKTSSDEGACAP
jgi:hypothetical protein